MKASVIVFPASNCDRDAAVALEQATGRKTDMVWHGDTDLPETDLIVLPGGFSYGDYLRCGAMASRSPVMNEVIARANKGVPVIGICNGFQVLCESGLLPGVLMRNAGLKFVCRSVDLVVEDNETIFTRGYEKGQTLSVPVAHHDGNYFADGETLDRLEGEGRVTFRYADGQNPNGSARDIAGICSENKRVLGMMPHPERVVSDILGGTDGKPLFDSLVEALA